MTKLSEHLQKRIREMAHEYDKNCWRNESYHCPPETTEAFYEGASAMHSLMLEELKPIVEAIEFSAANDMWESDGEYIESFSYQYKEWYQDRLKKALSHYRERIKGE